MGSPALLSTIGTISRPTCDRCRVKQLPPLHRDPFDRLLLAHALSERLHLLTADPQLEPYSALVQLV